MLYPEETAMGQFRIQLTWTVPSGLRDADVSELLIHLSKNTD